METNNSTSEANGFYKLTWLQRIGFGSGDLAQNLIFQTVACYLMIYLTTVLKLNPAFVSGLILTVRLIDCFWSPVVSCSGSLHRQSQSQVRQVSYLSSLRRYSTDSCRLLIDASPGCHMVYGYEVGLCYGQLYRSEHDLFRCEHSLRFHHGQYDP